MKKHETREAWLTVAGALLQKDVEKLHPKPLAAWKISVGFPYKARSGKGSHAIGQCWCASQSKGKTFEIFIHPERDDAVDVLAIVLHELVHVAVGIKEGHKRAFKRLATSLGLEGPMRATVAGDALKKDLKVIADKCGPFPHAALTPGVGTGAKKQGTRLIKVQCPACEYTVRITQKWLDTGLPTCPCETKMQIVGG